MTGRERTLGIVTGVALALGGGWSLLIQPAWERWTRADAQARSLEQALEAERALARGLDRARKERQELDARLRPEGGEASAGLLAAAFLAHVRALGKASGFEPSTLRQLGARPLFQGDKRRGARDEKPPFAELTFELRARTTLDKLTDFLVRLADSDRAVRVSSIAVTPRPGGGAELDVDLGLVALAPADVLQ
ncbi:MAG: type II secretion system protein M [Planctomycetes bacterium]|nr:type II secretion system protein M [Planctomycetota bacterium]